MTFVTYKIRVREKDVDYVAVQSYEEELDEFDAQEEVRTSSLGREMGRHTH